MDNNNFTARLIGNVLSSKLPLIILIISMLAGMLALKYMAREEEPQIVVPMIDIIATVPGVNVNQVERLVTTPLEKLLAQVKGVENVYSTTTNGKTVVTLRFFVGENRELALLNTYNKLHSNTNKIAAIVTDWRVKPVEVDDVPIMLLGLWSNDPDKVDDYTLRRLAQEVSTFLQGIEDTSEVNIVGGRLREIQININPEQMAARKVAIQDILAAIQSSNALQHLDNLSLANKSFRLESGDVYRDIESLEQTPVSVLDGTVILLKDVATIFDGPAEQKSYSWIDFTDSSVGQNTVDHQVVTISIAKQRGSNAVSVAKAVHKKIAQLKLNVFPESVDVVVIRDYGKTADEKVNNLTASLLFAIFTVVVFIAVFLGWRSALVVGLAIPICYGITLALNMSLGFTINRVTLFALILSLGLLVDDPITGVDNIERYLKKSKGAFKDKIVGAINEIRIPLLMSTLTIVLAFIPLAFITGMMGPYMGPMAFNVPIAVISSTIVAFLVTPWLASKFIKAPEENEYDQSSEGFSRFYRKHLSPLLDDRKKGIRVLWGVLALFIIAAMLPVLRLVPLKLLPFDNKNELQIIVDMPESSTLEQTAALVKEVSTRIRRLPEIDLIVTYVGIPSPIDFNGMVRQYYQRQASYSADIRLKLIDKTKREHQSHAVVLRLRELLASLNENDINIKVVEVPPGPPVLSTLVAELYGDELTDYQQLRDAAELVKARLAIEPFVVEIDSTVGNDQTLLRFETDKTKAALSGISTADINQVFEVANQGKIISYMQFDNEASPLPIKLRLPLKERTSVSDFYRLTVKGRAGIVQNITPQGIDLAPQSIVAIGELGEFNESVGHKTIIHKDLRQVVYVTADISGRPPVEIIADVSSDMQRTLNFKIEENPTIAKNRNENNIDNDWQSRTFLNSGAGKLWHLPDNIEINWSGEGEWRITLRVFRDMGLAFIFALIVIYFVLRIQTASAALAGIIMSAIPLTVIGIMPGFLLLNQFGEREISGAPDPVLFTATAMIGMIALAGIVIRNSLILIEFISQARSQGAAIKEALLQAGAVRMRPVLLTAGTTLLGNLIITLDPVFSGLAVAIIFGIISSTIFTLVVVPIVYLLIFDQPEQAKV